jgi:hypothetical protein
MGIAFPLNVAVGIVKVVVYPFVNIGTYFSKVYAFSCLGLTSGCYQWRELFQ